MTDWIFSFLVAAMFVSAFFFGELLRELELEDKAIKDGFKHLTSRCDYRIFLILTYLFATTVVAACLHSYSDIFSW
jgi:hypothetical protein